MDTIREAEFLTLMQRRIAQTAIGNSALRNQGAQGLHGIACEHMEREIILEEFFEVMENNKDYQIFLDKHTDKLLEKFPPKGKSWGAARKALNLFLRDLTYNKYIADRFNMPSDFEQNKETLQFLELPLDSYVTEELRKHFKNLPKWPLIKYLTKEISDEYQENAMELSVQKNIARVHLDLEFWRNNKN